MKKIKFPIFGSRFLNQKSKTSFQPISLSARQLISLIILCLVWIFASEAKIVEKILVVVNDDIITKTEFDERFTKNKEAMRQLYQYDEARLSAEMEKAKPELLETIIDELLFIQEATKKGIQIPDSEIEQYVVTLKKQYGSDEAFGEALKAEGYTLDSLKRERHRALLLQELIKQEFGSGLIVTDDEVRKFYRENRDKFPSKSDAVRLKHIFIKFYISDPDEQETLRKAEEVLNKCKAGADFGEMVVQFSDDEITKASGGDIGYFVPGMGKYDPNLEKAASKLAVGQISDLIEVPGGYDIIKVTDIKGQSVRAQHIHIAMRPTPEAEKAAEDKARLVLDELKNGADFAEMAKKYSDDPLTKNKGGDWKDISIDSMGPDLSKAFSSYDESAVSQPVKTPFGIHIFKIVERLDLTDDEMEQLREFLSRNKLQEKLSEYSKKLREKAYIQRLAED